MEEKEEVKEEVQGDRGMYSNIEQQQSQKDSVIALCILIVVQGIFSLWPVLVVIALQGKLFSMNLLIHLFTYLLTEQDLVATIVIYRDFFAVISLWYESLTHPFTTALVSSFSLYSQVRCLLY